MKTKRILALTAIVTFISGCGSAVRDNFNEEISDPVKKIIYYASLAGSSHNSQPWYVSIENDSVIHIKADFSRKLHIVDPASRELFISIGAFIENLSLAAGSMGYYADIVITAKHNNDADIATIKLIKAPKSEYDLTEIESRRTLRTAFHKTDISKEHLAGLINNNESEIIYFPASSKEGKYIAVQTLAAYTRQAKDDQAKLELENWIRFSNSDVKKHRDGLTTAGMGITGLGGFFVRNFYKPEDSGKDSFVEAGISKAKEQTENCGGWILIVQKEDNPDCWIKTGRLYEGINLACRNKKIGFHPMNQLIEEENYEQEANNYLATSGVIQFVARIGYVDDYPPANSVRRPVKDIIRNSGVKNN